MQITISGAKATESTHPANMSVAFYKNSRICFEISLKPPYTCNSFATTQAHSFTAKSRILFFFKFCSRVYLFFDKEHHRVQKHIYKTLSHT